MRVYFFNRIDSSYRYFFQSYITLQNLKTTRLFSLVYIFINVTLRLIITFNDLAIRNIAHIDEFKNANWVSLIFASFFYLGSLFLIRNFEQTPSLNFVRLFFSQLFALFIIISGMRVTFFAMHNPRNTLVMYLMGLLLAGIFLTFEYFETIFITIVTALCFAFMLPFYQHSFDELLLNNTVSVILMVMFFCVSRVSFSYRADNYLKLKAIEEKNQEIETASELKNEILGIVAHDLRNPLTAIKTMAMMMELDATMNHDNIEYLDMIKLSCDKATTIINDLIETAHNDIDNVFDIEEVELNQYLLKIVDEWVKNKKDTANILYYGTDKPVYMHINVEKMQRVMDNLISNAIKFSGEDEHVEINLKFSEDKIFIEVKDFGMGIPETLLPYIFDRFSRASRRGIRGEESVGLGLSIVRQIVKKHGGEIEVYSTEKEGTTFTINMPRQKINVDAQTLVQH